MKSFSFGDSPEMADELLDLVIQGKKTATSWAAVHGDLGSRVGQQQIIKDSQDRDRVIIEVTDLTVKKFTEVDEVFAREEGEGDLSLECWQSEHERYFSGEGTFSPEMKICCQRFKVLDILRV